MNAVVLAIGSWFVLMLFFLFINTFDVFNTAQVGILWLIGIAATALCAVILCNGDVRKPIQEYLDSLGRKNE